MRVGIATGFFVDQEDHTCTDARKDARTSVSTSPRARERERDMGQKLFVGGLSWGTTDDSLRSAFEQFGEISEAKVVLERDTGRSRGFGFVTYTDPSAAANAMTEMDGSELDGRNIRVNEASERPPRRNGGFGGGGGGGGGGGEPRGRSGGGRRGDRGRRNERY